MGINIAEDLVNENHTSPEEKLWRYVLINAFASEAKYNFLFV